MRDCRTYISGKCRVCGNSANTPDPILGTRRTPNRPRGLCMACYIDCTCPWCQEKYEGNPSPSDDYVYCYASTDPQPCVVCGGIHMDKLGGAAAVLKLYGGEAHDC